MTDFFSVLPELDSRYEQAFLSSLQRSDLFEGSLGLLHVVDNLHTLSSRVKQPKPRELTLQEASLPLRSVRNNGTNINFS
jgi:hypothetical protein